ncbi:MAG: DUF2541 family protein [Hyphomicrobiaceae bacterium]
MFRRTFLAGAACALAVLPLTTAAEAQRGPDRGRWEMLGSQSVGFTVDRDVIRVGRREGRFRAIKLRVKGNDVYMMDLKVVYGNGSVDDLPVRAEIKEGRETRAIDLKGDRRVIREVQMTYRRKPNFRGKAVVEVWGLH